MDDSVTFSARTARHLTTASLFAVPEPPGATARLTEASSDPWQRTTFNSLGAAEVLLDELAAANREHQLVVLGPELFVIEWR
jgi:hypothetical protein